MITGCCQILFIRRWDAFKGFKVKHVSGKVCVHRFLWGKWMQWDFENVQQEKGAGIPGKVGEARRVST